MRLDVVVRTASLIRGIYPVDMFIIGNSVPGLYYNVKSFLWNSRDSSKLE